jgi:tRNA (cmo5U34)-methyltransferase
MNQQITMPEEMASFFDARADGYEEHMGRVEVRDGDKNDRYYLTLASPISRTNAPVRILDLGAGTGFELSYIFRNAPNARITCIDMSVKMLELLQHKYQRYMNQLEIVLDSYTTRPFAQNHYDYAVSATTIHHLLEDAKLALYRKIRHALKDGSCYIEADYVVDEETERKHMQTYHEKIQMIANTQRGDPNRQYHIDVPFTVPHQEQLLGEAGFSEVISIHHEENGAIFVAWK